MHLSFLTVFMEELGIQRNQPRNQIEIACEVPTGRIGRWSTAESGGNIVVDRDDIPSGVEPSLVAVWSQFLGYEPSGIPALSSMVTPSFK